MRRALALALIVVLLACTRPADPAARGGTTPPATSNETTAAPAPAAASTVAAASATQRPGRLFFDLAAHPERAELRHGTATVIDFGETAGAKYTWGGWLSGVSRDVRHEGTSASLAPEKVVKLSLPLDQAGPATLVLRARSFAATPLVLHVNDRPLPDLALSGKAFELLRVEIPAEALRAGENVLQLRVMRTGSGAGIASAGLLLDWLRLSPAPATDADRAPPTLGELRAVDGAGVAHGLHVPAGYTLGYAFEVPEGAVLVGELAAGTAARLSIGARRDGAPVAVLADLSSAKGATPIEVSLAQLAGQIVRLDVQAPSGAVRLPSLRVETAPSTDAAAKTPPVKNAIVILIDTLRADALQPYREGTRVKTPGLTTFLEDAAVMLNARTQENWTKPSVATLLSSLLPWQHEAVTGDARVPASVELLPELLQERGFFTGAFIANGYVSDKFGFKQGWNSYRNYIREGRRSPAQFVIADVLEWLDARPKDKPFFLYVHTIDPHVPYKPPEQFLSMYDAAPYEGPVSFRKTGDLLERIKIGSMKLNARDKVRLRALYDAEISYHDVHFAALMEGLAQRGIAGETLVAITADHGEEFWDHGSVGHGHSVYDELLHVPLIMRVPGMTQHKQRLSDAVGLVDVMPTVLDALGQPIPQHLVGRSILPELRGEGSSAPRAAVSGFMGGWRTLGVGDFKLVQRTLGKFWLYDVSEDPGETKDLAPERPIALRYLRGLLGLTLHEQGDDQTPARAARKHVAEKTKIDPQTEAQLRALGYVGTSAP